MYRDNSTGVLYVSNSATVGDYTAITSSAATISGVIPVANGGTGLGTWNPGGIFYYNSGTTLSQTTSGSTSQYLKGGTIPVFATLNQAAVAGLTTADSPIWTGATLSALTAARVMVTGTGGLLAVSSVTATTLGFLDATSSVQTQLNAKQATITNLPATLGGTGNTSYVAGDLLDASSTSALGRFAAVATGSVLMSGGVGVAPTWSTNAAATSTTVGGAVFSGGLAVAKDSYFGGTLSATKGNTIPTETGFVGGNVFSLGTTWQTSCIHVVNNDGGTFVGSRFNGSFASKTTLSLNDTMFRIRAYGYDGTQFLSGANIVCAVDGSVSTGVMPTRLLFQVSNSVGTLTSALTLNAASSLVVGSQVANATTATGGFLYIPTVAGTPTGVPTAYSGTVALQYDTTNNKLYVYNGAWKSTIALL